MQGKPDNMRLWDRIRPDSWVRLKLGVLLLILVALPWQTSSRSWYDQPSFDWAKESSRSHVDREPDANQDSFAGIILTSTTDPDLASPVSPTLGLMGSAVLAAADHGEVDIKSDTSRRRLLQYGLMLAIALWAWLAFTRALRIVGVDDDVGAQAGLLWVTGTSAYVSATGYFPELLAAACALTAWVLVDEATQRLMINRKAWPPIVGAGAMSALALCTDLSLVVFSIALLVYVAMAWSPSKRPKALGLFVAGFVLFSAFAFALWHMAGGEALGPYFGQVSQWSHRNGAEMMALLFEGPTSLWATTPVLIFALFGVVEGLVGRRYRDVIFVGSLAALALLMVIPSVGADWNVSGTALFAFVYILAALGMARCHLGPIGRTLVKICVAGSVLFHVLVVNLASKWPGGAPSGILAATLDEVPKNLASFFFDQPTASGWGLVAVVGLVLGSIVGIGVNSWLIKLIETPAVVVGSLWLAISMGGGLLGDVAGDRFDTGEIRRDQAIDLGKDIMDGIDEIQRQHRENQSGGSRAVPLPRELEKAR